MPPVALDPDALDALEAGARDLGIETVRLPSAAAHDGMNLAATGVPVGMVFVRSERGLSHAPAEHSSDADIATGTRILAAGALRLAGALD